MYVKGGGTLTWCCCIL